MDAVTCGLIDCSVDAVRESYERAFYEAFAPLTQNRLIRTLWIWDNEARRLRTRVAYDEQWIYALTAPDGTVCSALAVNTCRRELQSGAFGFALPEGAGAAGVCEFLTFFAVEEHVLSRKFILWDACFLDLRAKGFHRAYATTAAKVLPVYRWLGAEVVAETEVQGEARYFLRFNLERSPGQRRGRG